MNRIEYAVRRDILDELFEIMQRVPMRADGNINGFDFVQAILSRKRELRILNEKGNGETPK